MKSIISLLGCMALILWQAPAAGAEEAGAVVFARGAVTVQKDGGAARLVGKGTELRQGETITTGRSSYAVLGLADGSRISLRPGTAFRIEQLDTGAGTEHVLLRLFRGGLRAITGFISKRRPDGYRLATAVATIGIRGTEFDARLCEQDCAGQAGTEGEHGLPETSRVIGRVVVVRGTLQARRAGGTPRHLVKGGPVYAGDTLVTGADAHAVIALRDRGRITLLPGTVFRIEKFRFSKRQPDSGNALFRLIKGGLRALSGLIGKRRHENYRLVTALATIGIRGTGFDLLLTAGCDEAAAGGETTGDGTSPGCLYASVWEGSISATREGREFALGPGDYRLGTEDRQPLRLPEPPRALRETAAPRPDRIPVDHDALFGVETRRGTPPGLYVALYDGHVTIENPHGSVDLGAGEAAYTTPEGAPGRLRRIPAFLYEDPYLQSIEPGFDPLQEPLGQGPAGQLQCQIR